MHLRNTTKISRRRAVQLAQQLLGQLREAKGMLDRSGHAVQAMRQALAEASRGWQLPRVGLVLRWPLVRATRWSTWRALATEAQPPDLASAAGEDSPGAAPGEPPGPQMPSEDLAPGPPAERGSQAPAGVTR